MTKYISYHVFPYLIEGISSFHTIFALFFLINSIVEEIFYLNWAVILMICLNCSSFCEHQAWDLYFCCFPVFLFFCFVWNALSHELVDFRFRLNYSIISAGTQRFLLIDCFASTLRQTK